MHPDEVRHVLQLLALQRGANFRKYETSRIPLGKQRVCTRAVCTDRDKLADKPVAEEVVLRAVAAPGGEAPHDPALDHDAAC